MGAYAGVCGCRSCAARQRRQAQRFVTSRPQRRNSLLAAEAKMKVTAPPDIHGAPMFFRVTDDNGETEYSRFPSEAEANAFLQGFLAGQASLDDSADSNAATEPAI